MDECKVGHHHAECLRPIYSAENLSADSFQFIGNLEGQRKYESGVDTLKWNVQPLVVVERNKLRLSGLARVSAGETILRFGRAVAFFAAGIWFPCRYVSYSISILARKTTLQTIVAKEFSRMMRRGSSGFIA
jgi:hypothetical protein